VAHQGYAIGIGVLVSPEESFYDLFDTTATEGVLRLEVLKLTEWEINAFVKAFSIHPSTSDDIKTGETREKVEFSTITTLSVSSHFAR
jgi:Mg2+ and Co2+ transporter CorA